MIKVQSLDFEYFGKRVLYGVSFEVTRGSITALVGPNGAGKTTLMRVIAALETPYSGTVSVAGFDTVEQGREVHKRIGYLSDFFGVEPDLTVRQSLILAGKSHLIEGAQLHECVNQALAILEFTEATQNQKAGELSRGWRQRLGIAMAIIHKPELLILDEPASGLDPEARITLASVFKKLQADGMTLLVSSHILAELEDYCTEMLILREGRLTQHAASPNQRLQDIYMAQVANPS